MASTQLSRNGAPQTIFTITKSDSNRLDGLQWIRCGGDGNLVLKSIEPDALSITIAVTAGEYVPFGSGYVMNATTATPLVGFA